MFDVLIVGGQIIDGSGNVGFPGSIGIAGDRIQVLRGDVSSVEAGRRIDATGRIVCPGFIDFHAHSGLVILAEPHHLPKVHQGVTTEVIGVDGNLVCSISERGGPAPLHRAELRTGRKIRL